MFFVGYDLHWVAEFLLIKFLEINGLFTNGLQINLKI